MLSLTPRTDLKLHTDISVSFRVCGKQWCKRTGWNNQCRKHPRANPEETWSRGQTECHLWVISIWIRDARQPVASVGPLCSKEATSHRARRTEERDTTSQWLGYIHWKVCPGIWDLRFFFFFFNSKSLLPTWLLDNNHVDIHLFSF